VHKKWVLFHRGGREYLKKTSRGLGIAVAKEERETNPLRVGDRGGGLGSSAAGGEAQCTGEEKQVS